MSEIAAPAARTPADLTSAVRLVDASRNERIVLAESALLGERAMALFRFVLVAAMGASHLLAASLGQGSAAPTGPRLAAIVSYLLFTLGGLFVMRQSRPDPLAAKPTPPPQSAAGSSLALRPDRSREPLRGRSRASLRRGRSRRPLRLGAARAARPAGGAHEHRGERCLRRGAPPSATRSTPSPPTALELAPAAAPSSSTPSSTRPDGSPAK